VGGLIREMAIIEAYMLRSATVIAGTSCELVEIGVPSGPPRSCRFRSRPWEIASCEAGGALWSRP
jgi:hypothetical protein